LLDNVTTDREPDPHAEIRAEVRKLCLEFPGAYWRELDRDAAYPEAFVKKLGANGWLAALIPEEYGGSGLTLSAAAAILEEVQRAGCNGAACHAQIYIMGTVLLYGSAAQKSLYLPQIASGALRLQAFGVTEPTSGTDTTALKTTARLEGDDYVINGQKIWTSRAEYSDLMLLLARTTPRDQVKKRTDGHSVFLLDMRKVKDNGLTIRPIRTMMNHATTEVFFDNMRIPADTLVGEEGKGFRYILSGMNAERILIGAECIGDAKWFTEKSCAYANDTVRVRPSHRAESGRSISDRESLCADARRRADGVPGRFTLRSRPRLRRRSQHGETARGRGVLGGGGSLLANAWRLRVCERIRCGAEIPRDAAVPGGADLDQPDPQLSGRACAWYAKVILRCDVLLKVCSSLPWNRRWRRRSAPRGWQMPAPG
jgi:acyl-CoA dehydrogenase